METIVDYDDIQRLLVRVMLKKTLPKYIMNYKTDEYYPVIIGGQNVLRCTENNKKVATLMSGVYSSDIDIDFIVTKQVVDNNVPLIKALHHQRMQFINDIINDEDFQDALNKIMIDYSHLDMHVKATVDNDMLHIDPIVAKSMVVRIRINYFIGYEPSSSLTLLDTVIYSTYSKPEHYDLFKYFTRSKVSLPIPYKLYNGLPFAYCEHAYYDTIRMLDTYAKEISSTKGTKRFKVLLTKYGNLLIKFSALYCLLNTVTRKKYEMLKNVYENVRKVLLSVHPFDDVSKNIPFEEKKKLDEIYTILRDVTDIDLMIKIIKREETMVRFTSKFRGVVKTRSSRVE
jgi:hypothetical protein